MPRGLWASPPSGLPRPGSAVLGALLANAILQLTLERSERVTNGDVHVLVGLVLVVGLAGQDWRTTGNSQLGANGKQVALARVLMWGLDNYVAPDQPVVDLLEFGHTFGDPSLDRG